MKPATRQMFLAFLLITCALDGHAQQPTSPAEPDVNKLLAQLGSAETVTRNDALEQLRSAPEDFSDPRIKSALINLLDRENQLNSSGGDEGYHEYLDWLSDAAAKVVDWNDQRQVCILANSWDLSDQLADHAKQSIPCLLKRVQNRSSDKRRTAIAMMVQTLATDKKDLDASSKKTVQNLILNALHDSDEDIRVETIEALKNFGGVDMIRPLREVAENYPSEHAGISVRKFATEAIAAIQQRAQQQQTTPIRH